MKGWRVRMNLQRYKFRTIGVLTVVTLSVTCTDSLEFEKQAACERQFANAGISEQEQNDYECICVDDGGGCNGGRFICLIQEVGESSSGGVPTTGEPTTTAPPTTSSTTTGEDTSSTTMAAPECGDEICSSDSENVNNCPEDCNECGDNVVFAGEVCDNGLNQDPPYSM